MYVLYIIYIYIYLFHPRYLHNDIFRYNLFHVTDVCTGKLTTLVVIATGQTFQFSQVFTAKLRVTLPLVLTTVLKISSVE